MSAVNKLLSRGETVLLATGHGDLFTVIKGASVNKKFTARIDVESVIDPDAPLGADPRMQSTLRILDMSGIVFSKHDIVGKGGKSYKILKLVDNNPESITEDYAVELIK